MNGPHRIYNNSGKQTDSAARGTRQPSRTAPEPNAPWLGVRSELGLWVLVAALVVALILIGAM